MIRSQIIKIKILLLRSIYATLGSKGLISRLSGIHRYAHKEIYDVKRKQFCLQVIR